MKLEKKKIFDMSDEEKEFARRCMEKCLFPPEFLLEMRARRRKWTRQYLVSLPNYEQQRELVDEMAIVGLPYTEYISPYDPDWRLLDAMASRWARERCEAFQRFLQAEKQGNL